jgi:hypothetical protein
MRALASLTGGMEALPLRRRTEYIVDAARERVRTVGPLVVVDVGEVGLTGRVLWCVNVILLVEMVIYNSSETEP